MPSGERGLTFAKRGLVEAFVFAAAVMFYIWVWRFDAPWVLWLLISAALLNFVRLEETLESTGLSPRRFAEALRAWWFVWPLALLALVVVLQERIISPRLITRGIAYLAWSTIQQVLYQTFVYRRVRYSLGAGFTSWLLSGAIFGLVHWPNPVLVPATALWGAVSSRLFERCRSVPALALLQFVMSSLLYELTPFGWHHGFRVGPTYYFY